MGDLRLWQLSLSQPYALQIAADARLSQTDYGDDQTWEVRPGSGDSAALALQTRYGGRAGLVSIVPMWQIDGQAVYQAQQYAAPVTIRAFAPGYAQLEARLSKQIALLAEFWVMESHAAGGRFTLRNGSKQAVKLRLDLLGFVGSEGREQPLRTLTLSGDHVALAFGLIGNLAPMLILDQASASLAGHGNKVAANIALNAGGRTSLRFVCAALPDPRESLALAQRWLAEDWGKHLKRVSAAAGAIPAIETGDDDLDAVIAFGYAQLLQAFLKPAGKLPYASFVRTRQPEAGYSPRSTGIDYADAWAGQPAHLAYLAALAVAPVDNAIAQGLLRNYLAARSSDGVIDYAPGIAGQISGILCPPLLARMAWSTFQYDEDAAFLREVYPQLKSFLNLWLAKPNDRDGDGAPEWSSTEQPGYLSPLLAGQPLAPDTVEMPGLIAYLISEAISLREMAYFLRDASGEAEMKAHIERLQATLESFWDADSGRYRARDRDTHEVTRRVDVLKDGAGDEAHLLAYKLDPPSRLIIEIEGGWQHTPKVLLHLDGTAPDGSEIHETADHTIFGWRMGRGHYTSQEVFARIDRIQCEGLVRVYRVNAYTPDMTAEDVDGLLPLWSVGLVPPRAAALVRAMTDAQRFWRPSGVPTTTGGAEARVYPFMVTLLGEGLLEYGYVAEATTLVKRLLAAQAATLMMNHTFAAYYDADQARGYNANGDIAGLPPLHLLLRVLGVRIISRTRLWTGGAFAWGAPIKVTHRGVVVQRSDTGTQVHFPSGRLVTLPPDAPWQEIIDAPTDTPGT